MKARRFALDLLEQAKYVVLAISVLSASLVVFAGLLLVLFVVNIHAGGHLKCDTYTTQKLAKWIGFIRDACKDQPGFSK